MKLEVHYDRIYDEAFSDFKEPNKHIQIRRLPNPSLLILKALTQIYNLEDQVTFVPCNSNTLFSTYMKINEKEVSFYRAIFYLEYHGRKIFEEKHNPKKRKSVRISDCATVWKNNGDTVTKIITTIYKEEDIFMDDDTIDKDLFILLKEFQDTFDYFLFMHSSSFEKFTRLICGDGLLNKLMGYLKLQRHKMDLEYKYKHQSLDFMLKRMIFLIHYFCKDNNSESMYSIGNIIGYVYFYSLLSIPLYLLPWDYIDKQMHQKIFNDGNLNMIANVIHKNKSVYFKYLITPMDLSIELGHSDSSFSLLQFETFDFNIACCLDVIEKNPKDNIVTLVPSNDNSPNLPFSGMMNDYRILRNIGCAFFEHIYNTHFYSFVLLKNKLLIEQKIKIIQQYFPTLINKLLQMDREFSSKL